MGLASVLVEEFSRLRIPGWRAEPEAELFSTKLANRYGYKPRVDLLLTNTRDDQRIAVELEISRADPVANQVKFYVASRAGELRPTDVLVSLFSAHIARGRRKLAAAYARQLRADGLAIFTAALLPQLDGAAIKRLNSAKTLDAKRRRDLHPRAELDRVLAVALPHIEGEHRIHFAGGTPDVVANVWQWNSEVTTPSGAETWGRRQVQYFVYDPTSGLFAPSKFCAFIPAWRPGGPPAPPRMTLGIYAALGERNPRFDGHRAWKHLTDRLAFRRLPVGDSDLGGKFDAWLEIHVTALQLRKPAFALMPPA